MKRERINRPLGQRRKKTGIFYYFSLFIFLGALVYVLFFSGFLEISEISVAGTEALNPNLIGETVQTEISGSFFKYLKKNNFMLALFRKKHIEKVVAERFKKISKAEIKAKFPNALRINISERASMLILCSAEECFVIDEKGIAYSKADFESDLLKENQLLILRDESGKKIEIGQAVLGQDYLNYIYSISNGVEGSLGISLEREISTPRIISGDIRAKTSEGWLIYFNADIPIDKEMEMLQVVIDKKIEGTRRSDLEYVDLRTDNRVYYKFRTPDPQPEEIKANPPEKTEPAKDKKKKG
ncbi:MAG: FtsQ-type POTRA domain-containing protein [Candidatus Moranbacteria bacterium]|nr:FtsQ-type POTRA domain-containing protein [Candidatus Moranbacteria bacterium]